jgi:hypothetical protein
LIISPVIAIGETPNFTPTQTSQPTPTTTGFSWSDAAIISVIAAIAIAAVALKKSKKGKRARKIGT